MRNHTRSVAMWVLRAFLLAAGVLGGFALVDAVLLFVVLAGLSVFAPNPYMGLIMFVGLPLLGLVGAALVWIAYVVLRDRTPSSPPGNQHAHA